MKTSFASDDTTVVVHMQMQLDIFKEAVLTDNDESGNFDSLFFSLIYFNNKQLNRVVKAKAFLRLLEDYPLLIKK